MEFKYRLRELRLRRNITQRELANVMSKALHKDIPPQVISYWENGRNPSIEELCELARYFSVSVDDLVGFKKADSGSLESIRESILVYDGEVQEVVVQLIRSALDLVKDRVEDREQLKFIESLVKSAVGITEEAYKMRNCRKDEYVDAVMNMVRLRRDLDTMVAERLEKILGE